MQEYDFDALEESIQFKYQATETLENGDKGKAKSVHQAILILFVSLDS